MMVKQKADMRFKINFAVTLFALFIMAGCGTEQKPAFTEEEMKNIPLPKRDGLPTASDGFVLGVSGEAITCDEIIKPMMERFESFAKGSDFDTFQRRIKPSVDNVVMGKIADILLYQKAKSQGGEQLEDALDKAVESEVRKFVIGFNNNYAAAEKSLKGDGMDWVSFRDYQRRMILSQSYLSTKMPDNIPITYSEMFDYYNKTKNTAFTSPAQLQFSLIDIDTRKVVVTDPNKNSILAARELSAKLVDRLNAGEDFAKLAKEYSNDYRAQEGGLWKTVEPNSLAQPYDVIAAESRKLSPGQIAGPIENKEHFFIIKLEKKEAGYVKSFEEVQKQIETEIKFNRRKKEIDTLTEKLVEQAALSQKDEFVTFCIQKMYYMAKTGS